MHAIDLLSMISGLNFFIIPLMPNYTGYLNDIKRTFNLMCKKR